MKVTTGSIALLITVGGLIFYLGNIALEEKIANAASPMLDHNPRPAEISSIDTFASLQEWVTQLEVREAELDSTAAQLNEQSNLIDQQLIDIAQKQDELDARQNRLDVDQTKLDVDQISLNEDRERLENEKLKLIQDREDLEVLRVELEKEAKRLDLLEITINIERSNLDEEWDLVRKIQNEYRTSLWVLYVLIGITSLVLLVCILLMFYVARDTRQLRKSRSEDKTSASFDHSLTAPPTLERSYAFPFQTSEHAVK